MVAPRLTDLIRGAGRVESHLRTRAPGRHVVSHAGNAYQTPRVTTYGTLRDLTSSEAMFGASPLAQGALSLSPVVLSGVPGGGDGPGGPGGEGAPGVSGEGPGGGEGPDGEVAGETAAVPGEAAAQEGESLPFTGLAAGAVAAVGGVVTAAGAALRRVASRRR